MQHQDGCGAMVKAFGRDTPHLSYTPIPQIFMEHLMCQRAAELDKAGRKSCPPGAWLLRTCLSTAHLSVSHLKHNLSSVELIFLHSANLLLLYFSSQFMVPVFHVLAKSTLMHVVT